MRIEPEISGVQVVLLGDFNPAIFTPAWFALYELLPRGVAENAELQVAHNQVTEFRADWLTLQVTTERFLAATAQAPLVRVRDLVSRVFKELLYHTPLRAVGINRNVHFPVRSVAERDHVGKSLAPVAAWGPWSDKLALDSEHGGMTSLKMSQLHPKDRPPGSEINITVQPSNRIGSGRIGVFVGVNNHYEVNDVGPRAAASLMELFEKNFDPSLRCSDGIIDHVMSLATRSRT